MSSKVTGCITSNKISSFCDEVTTPHVPNQGPSQSVPLPANNCNRLHEERFRKVSIHSGGPSFVESRCNFGAYGNCLHCEEFLRMMRLFQDQVDSDRYQKETAAADTNGISRSEVQETIAQ
eukprot:3335396-Amphidinium_carterae.1